MASNSSKECGICSEEFNDQENCPRMLPCFHCFCSNCIDQLIATSNKSCPFCREPFNATCAKDFRINTIVLDLLKCLAELETSTKSPHRDRSMSYPVWQKDSRSEHNKENLEDCRKAKAQTENAIEKNAELRNEISQANTVIREEIFPRLEEIEAMNGKQIKDLGEENERLKTQLGAIMDQERMIEDTEAKLKVAAPIMDMTEEFEKLIEDWKGCLSRDEITHHSISKDVRNTNSKIYVIQDILSQASYDDDEKEVNLIPGMVTMAIQEDATKDICNAEAICPNSVLPSAPPGPPSPTHIRLNDLWKMTEPVRKMIIEGRLFAVQDLYGRKRYAKISITDYDQLLLHHLKEEEEEESLPANVHLLKYDEVMSLLDNSCRRIFLEICIGRGRSLGRIMIRLSHDQGNYDLNFFFLCTGQLGPSYVNSNIWEVFDKGNEWESVWMGDYESNDGKAGKPVVGGVDWGWEWGRDIYKRPWIKGTVQGCYREEVKASQFVIFTRDHPGRHLSGCFGMVESGLKVLTDAISHHPDETKIRIKDCGIVLFL